MQLSLLIGCWLTDRSSGLCFSRRDDASRKKGQIYVIPAETWGYVSDTPKKTAVFLLDIGGKNRVISTDSS